MNVSEGLADPSIQAYVVTTRVFAHVTQLMRRSKVVVVGILTTWKKTSATLDTNDKATLFAEVKWEMHVCRPYNYITNTTR